MRVMMKVSIPVEMGNRAFSDGSLQNTVMGFIESARPESSYFVTGRNGRTAYFFYDLKDSSSLPSIVEPFFSSLNASVEIVPAMNAEDLRTGIERAKKRTSS
jgi:hypothetical protein